MVTIVETIYRCSFCGGVLELMEDSRYIWFGCRRCMRYVKREKRAMIRRFVNYRKRRFYWRQLLDELYYLYTRRQYTTRRYS